MVNSIIQRANARLKFFIYRKHRFFNFKTNKLLVMSIIQCHFDYTCSFLYPGLTQFLCKNLQIIQNKVIRFVLNLDPRSNLGPDVFRSLRWVPVSKRVDQIVLNHVFKINSRTSLDYMAEHFVSRSAAHSYGTRFREKGCFPLSKIKGFGKKTFAFWGCKLWNDLPTNIKSMRCISKLIGQGRHFVTFQSNCLIF